MLHVEVQPVPQGSHVHVCWCSTTASSHGTSHGTPQGMQAGSPGEDLAECVVDFALVSDHDHGVVGVEAVGVLLSSDAEDAVHLQKRGGREAHLMLT